MSFFRFLGQYGRRLFPGSGGVGTSPGQLDVGGLLWAFVSLGVVCHIRSQRKNSLRTSGCIYRGRRDPQNDKAACSSIVWVLAGGYSCILLLEETNLTRKIYGLKINRSRKTAVGLARRAKPRHWFMTLVFL